jgi:replicative DNA helicase
VSIEVTLLQLLKYRDRYERLAKVVPTAALDAKSVIFLQDFGAYFKEFPDVTRIEHEPFMLWFKVFQHPTLNAEQLGLYAAMLSNVLNKDCEAPLEAGIMERLVAAETANRVTDLLTRWSEGDEVDLYVSLRGEVERHERMSSRKVIVPWVEDSIDDILLDDVEQRGLTWRLACLNNHMRPLREGDAIIWAGRPGRGKTSSLLGEVTHMAAQFDGYYGEGHGRYAVWLNNEGSGRKIVHRAYQSALFLTNAEMIRKSQAGTLRREYAEAMGGDENRLRVMNVHGFNTYEIEELLKRVRPGLIVFDMVDNVRFAGSAMNGGQRTDQLLEAMYQWSRDLAIKYGCPVIETSQTSSDAADLPFPSDHMLKDSKTGKQGACDGIVMLGMNADPFYANSRFISVVKSKMNLPGMPASPNAEVTFDGERCRLLMPEAA